jgi:hypothetical protein
MDRIRREDLSLESLMLNGDDRTWEGGFNLKLKQQLGEATKQHPSWSAKLQRMNLKNGRTGNKGLAAISEALGLCTNLQDLDLGNCDIGDAGLLALSKHLSKCTALRKLNFRVRSGRRGSEGPYKRRGHCRVRDARSPRLHGLDRTEPGQMTMSFAR